MITIVLGTRPEAVKLAPVVRELRRRGVPCGVLETGQHQSLMDDTSFRDEFAPLGLGVEPGADPDAYGQRVFRKCVDVWRSAGERRPHLVVVQGDTASPWGVAEAGAVLGIPVAHVEAGLRTGVFSDPWPEEGYRVRIDAVAARRYAPTPRALKVLLDEGGVAGHRDLLTGNTVVDALRHTGVGPVPGSEREDVVVVTLHRRESWVVGVFDAILSGLAEVAALVPTRFIFPAHPAPAVQGAIHRADLPSNVLVRSPMSYRAFVGLLSRSRGCLTDSGGLVEECATLGVPCVIARDHTERMEAVASGQALLAGRTAAGVGMALAAMFRGDVSSEPSLVFGDGTAAERIVDDLTERA